MSSAKKKARDVSADENGMCADQLKLKRAAILTAIVGAVCAVCAVLFARPVRLLRLLRPSTWRGRRGARRLVAVATPPGYKLFPCTGHLPVVLGIVLCTKEPVGFRAWLSHHWEVGVRHFYVRSEDTDASITEGDVSAGPWRDGVRLEHATGATSYFALMERQTAHVNRSVRVASEDGVTHLLHIDDDELLWCPNGTRSFLSHLHANSVGHDAGGSCVHLQNIEASYDDSECRNPFAAATGFVLSPADFTSYANGKSIGVVSESLRAHGPHYFTGRVVELPAHVGVVVHYESACFARWKTKFGGYVSNGESSACQHATGGSGSQARRIPFRFYCASMQAVSDDAIALRTWKSWKQRRRGARRFAVYKGRITD